MEIVNRVAESDIEVFNLEALWDGREVVVFDLAPFLVEGLVLRERPFREAIKDHDWAPYNGKHVAVHCSTDAIVPTWAYMLVASKLDGRAASVAFGSAADLRRDYYVRALDGVDWARYADKPVVIKGCGSKAVPVAAYLTATQRLQAVAAKLMYGEPCSAVPLWRRPKMMDAAPGAGNSSPQARWPAPRPIVPLHPPPCRASR